jgi:hypothetical protein
MEHGAEEFFHECPFQGIHSCYAQLTKEYLQLIPLGKLRIVGKIVDKFDSNILTVNTTITIFE